VRHFEKDLPVVVTSKLALKAAQSGNRFLLNLFSSQITSFNGSSASSAALGGHFELAKELGGKLEDLVIYSARGGDSVAVNSILQSLPLDKKEAVLPKVIIESIANGHPSVFFVAISNGGKVDRSNLVGQFEMKGLANLEIISYLRHNHGDLFKSVLPEIGMASTRYPTKAIREFFSSISYRVCASELLSLWHTPLSPSDVDLEAKLSWLEDVLFAPRVAPHDRDLSPLFSWAPVPIPMKLCHAYFVFMAHCFRLTLFSRQWRRRMTLCLQSPGVCAP